MLENKRLVKMREKLKLTQYQLATNVGISQSMVSLGERGEREFDDVTKAKLAKFFGVTVQWLFFDQRYCKMQSNPNNPDSAA